MGCMITDARDHPEIRRRVTELMRPRQKRIHFHDESLPERRRLIAGFAELPLQVVVAVARIGHEVDAEHARALCLRELVELLQHQRVARMVLESRHDDRRDAHTIIAARHSEPLLVFEHRQPSGEPMLWIADGVAWAGGVRGTDLDRFGRVLARVIEVGQ